MEGRVVKGKGLGKKIGIPTLNIRFSHELIPRAGVYSCELRIRSRVFRGALYVGKSFAQARNDKLFYPQRQTADAEVYIFNFDAHQYGRVKNNIAVRPVQFLRAPKAFTALDVFKKQAAEDIATIKRKAQSARFCTTYTRAQSVTRCGSTYAHHPERKPRDQSPRHQ
jgi:riboflavin kinase/FMN adenylyltransferase